MIKEIRKVEYIYFRLFRPDLETFANLKYSPVRKRRNYENRDKSCKSTKFGTHVLEGIKKN